VGRSEERVILSILDGTGWKAAAAGAGIDERRAESFLAGVAKIAARLGERPEREAPPVAEATGGRRARRAGTHEELVLHTDGASSGNPGPSGAGVVIADASGGIVEEIHRHIGHATSNAAEYEAVRLGLSRAVALGARRVRVRLDSELIARQLSGRYKVRHPGLLDAFLKVEALISRLDDVRFEAIPREKNARADRLARLGARRRG